VLSPTGRRDETLAEAVRAVELAPGEPEILRAQALVLAQHSRADDSWRAIRRGILATPAGLGRRPWAVPLMQIGRTAAAIQLIEEQGGARRDIIEAAARRLELAARERYVSACERARLSIATGDRMLALKLLETCVADREWQALMLPADPSWKDLRREARFEQLVRQLLLPATP
jgi:hypothetical protein